MTHKLLLADDSVTIQRVIELTFADEDVEVLTAGDGEQAIASIRRDRPDIVLADVGMPKRTGYDVAAFVKGEPELSHIPVLLLTGAFEPVDERRAQEAGCDGVLVKPFEPQHVIARVRELLDGARAASAGATRAVADVPRPIDRLSPPRPAGYAPGRGRPTQRAAQAPGSDLEDYFDRLDAAFASMATTGGETGAGTPPEAAPRHEGPVMERDLDWFDSPQTGAPPASTELPAPAMEHTAAGAPPSAGAPPEPMPVTFASPPSPSGWIPSSQPAAGPPNAASAQPRPAAPADQTPPQDPGGAIADAFSALLAVEQGEVDPGAVRLTLPAVSAPTAVTDDLVDAIAQRVAERLGSEALKDTIADVVSHVAERLVKEEIDRIRDRHGRS